MRSELRSYRYSYEYYLSNGLPRSYELNLPHHRPLILHQFEMEYSQVYINMGDKPLSKWHCEVTSLRFQIAIAMAETEEVLKVAHRGKHVPCRSQIELLRNNHETWSSEWSPAAIWGSLDFKKGATPSPSSSFSSSSSWFPPLPALTVGMNGSEPYCELRMQWATPGHEHIISDYVDAGKTAR